MLLEVMKIFLLESFLLYSGGIALFGGRRGLLGSFAILSVLNIMFNYYLYNAQIADFLFWEIIILVFITFGIIIDFFLNKKTSLYKLVSMSFGSLSALLLMIILISVVPALIIWTILIGIPIFFTYRDVGKAWMITHLLFKISFSLTLIVIGNFIY